MDQLPLWMQPVAWLTPLWHGVEASRRVATGQVDWLSLLLHLLVLVAFVAVGWVLCVRSFTTRLVT